MKRINIAVIGVGWIGNIHCECYTRVKPMLTCCELNLHTVVDVVEPAVRQAMGKYGFSAWATDWHTVTENPEIDVIDVCVDNKWHKDIVISAINNGKHVICEKPLATSVEDAELMTDLAERTGLVNMINFNYRKVPALAQIKELIEGGALGRIYHIKGLFLQDFGLTSPMTWRFKRSLAGGGSIITMGAHVIDTMRFLAGDFDEVSAVGATVIKERPDPRTGQMDACDVDDAMTVLVKFKNGAIGMLMTSWVSYGCKHHHAIEIYGEKGSVAFNSERLNEIELFLEDGSGALNGKRTVLVGQGNPYGELFNLKTGMGIGIKESFTIQLLDLLQGIAGGENKTPSFYDGMKVEKITRAILVAADTHTWVKVAE